MGRVICQKGFDELAEAEIEEQRTAVCTRARAHFRYLQAREHSNEFIHGKILAANAVAFNEAGKKIQIRARKDTYDSTATSVTDHEVLAWAQLVEFRKVGTVNRGGLGLTSDNVNAMNEKHENNKTSRT